MHVNAMEFALERATDTRGYLLQHLRLKSTSTSNFTQWLLDFRLLTLTSRYVLIKWLNESKRYLQPSKTVKVMRRGKGL